MCWQNFLPFWNNSARLSSYVARRAMFRAAPAAREFSFLGTVFAKDPMRSIRQGTPSATNPWTNKWKLAGVVGALALGGASQNPCCCDTESIRRTLSVGGTVPVSAPEPEKAKSAEPSLAKKCLAEVVGTGILIHFGCGVVCSCIYTGAGFGLAHNAAVWGIAVALAVYATRDVSGAHLNPAVTATVTVNGDFPIAHVLPYWASQLLGATAAGAMNYMLFSNAIAAHEQALGIVRGTAASTASFNGAFGMLPNAALISPMGAFLAEAWMTGVLAFMIFAITDSNNSIPSDAAAPVLIGATVATLISIFAPITCCGMNPARDLGPRIVTFFAGWGSAAATSAWIYTLGPIVGAVVGGALYNVLFSKKHGVDIAYF